MKRCSISCVIREIRSKTMRYNYTSIRIAKTWETDNTKCWRGCRTVGTLTHCCGNAKWYNHVGRQVVSFLPNATHSAYDPAIVPWYSSKGVGKLMCTHTHLHVVFIIGLFIIAQTWKKRSCSSASKWTNQLCVDKGVLFSPRKCELSSQKTNKQTWRVLKYTLQSRGSWRNSLPPSQEMLKGV